MKWVGLFLFILIGAAFVPYLRKSSRNVRIAAFLLGLLPFVMGAWHLKVSPFAWPLWPGYPRGLQVSLLDFLALAILFAVRTEGVKIRMLWPWGLYLGAVIVSCAFAQTAMASSFYVWQLIRVIILFAAAIRIGAIQDGPIWMFRGMVVGLLYHAIFGIAQAAQGQLQVSGEFGTQNLLGLSAHFVLFPSLALLLGGKRGVWPMLGVVSALILDVLTASRATIGFAAIGGALTVALSMRNSMTGRKGALAGAFVLLALLIAPIAISRISDRVEGNSLASSNKERAAFKQAAYLMIADYPFGVGPSHYVIVANTGGYSARADVAWNESSRRTPVHNSYLMVWAESGFLGLIAMVTLFASFVVTALRASMRFKRSPDSDFILGAGMAILIAALHLLYEWIFVFDLVQYLFAALAGTSVGIASKLALKQRPSERERSAPAPAPELRPAEAR